MCQKMWIQIRPDILSGLIWVQTVCKGYQQTTLVGIEFLTVKSFNCLVFVVFYFIFLSSCIMLYLLVLKLLLFVTPAFAKCIMGIKVSIHLSINVQPKLNCNGEVFVCPSIEMSGSDVVL